MPQSADFDKIRMAKAFAAVMSQKKTEYRENCA
jgi:hypothetical protein